MKKFTCKLIKFSQNKFMNQEYSSTDVRYTLDIRVPKKIPQRIDVLENVTIGSDPRNDIILASEDGSHTKQFTFKKRGNALVGINNFNGNHEVILNQTPMIEGKHYILEKGDTIVLHQIEIHIRQDSTQALSKSGEGTVPHLKFLDQKKKLIQEEMELAQNKSGTTSLNKVDGFQKSKGGILDKIKSFFKKSPAPSVTPQSKASGQKKKKK